MPTQVYSVIGGYDHEGEVFESLSLFDCKSTAEAYKEHLEEEYDYALIKMLKVDERSMFAQETNKLFALV